MNAALVKIRSRVHTETPTPLLKNPIYIVGAGGIGVALAWSLVRAGCIVTVVDADPRKVERGRREGLTVVGHGTEQASFTHFNQWAPPAHALILLCTKTYDNAAVLAMLPDAAPVVPVQNGFDTELDQRSHAGEGIASFVSECLRDQPVTRITRPGDLHLGPRRSVSAAETSDLAELAQALAMGALFSVRFVDDVRPYKATKLMFNAAISPLAAAAGVDNGELLTDSLAKRLFFGLLRENYAILRHARLPMAKIGPFHPNTVSLILRIPGLPSMMGAFFRPSLRGTYCSMTPDIVTERTEIDAYNGHLIRLAGRLPCPLNRAVFGLVNKIVRERLQPRRGNLDLLEGVLKGPSLC